MSKHKQAVILNIIAMLALIIIVRYSLISTAIGLKCVTQSVQGIKPDLKPALENLAWVISGFSIYGITCIMRDLLEIKPKNIKKLFQTGGLREENEDKLENTERTKKQHDIQEH